MEKYNLPFKIPLVIKIMPLVNHLSWAITMPTSRWCTCLQTPLFSRNLQTKVSWLLSKHTHCEQHSHCHRHKSGGWGSRRNMTFRRHLKTLMLPGVDAAKSPECK
jgi:hypothetical protein